MKTTHKKVSVSAETKIMAMLAVPSAKSRAFIRLMQDAETTYAKRRNDQLKQMNKETSGDE